MARTYRQRLGQHFLADRAAASGIVASLASDPPRVLEIGPGRGALTGLLVGRFGRVRAIELDRALAARLPGRLGRPTGLEVITGDALTIDLASLASDGPWQVVANLPYAVGTPIVRRLLPRHDLFPNLLVMLQLEVVRRLVAPAGSRERGLVSLEVEAYADARVLFTVPPRSFSPPPRVSSAVVNLRLHAPPASESELSAALAHAARAFCHRRKKLANALAGDVGETSLDSWLARAGVDGELRPQVLSLADWIAIARAREAT